MSEPVVVPPSPRAEGREGAGQERDSPGGIEADVEAEEEDNETANMAPNSHSRGMSQSTLVPYRTPVLPNLAQAALQRLKNRTTSGEDDADFSDFQPPKRRTVEESESADEDKEV